MKTQLSSSHLSHTKQRSGVALVIVLSMIVLMSALMVAFMSRVSTEQRSAKIALQGFEARQAAETAVNLVISQIRQATYDPANPDRAWASQPGLIRTFQNGADAEVIKLYSAAKMREGPKEYSPNSPKEAGIDTGEIAATPPGFANLNEPIFVPVRGKDGKDYYEAYFPICDPRAKNDENGRATTPGKGIVRGFHSANVSQRSDKPKKDADGNVIPTLPMNVRWLFQLRDGQLVAAEIGDDDKLTIPNATTTNPPIARVAFWTDDDSCKPNINTAAENTYWDTPSASTVQEAGRINTDGTLQYNPSDPDQFLALAASQPNGDEFQRFPGHPATTSLSPAIGWLFPLPTSSRKGPKYTEPQRKEAIYRLTPRVYGGIGTTMGATRNTQYPTTDHRVYERDRLYSTVDEYFFRPDRSPLTQNSFYNAFQTTDGASEDAPSKDLANPYFTPEALQRMRFFLTANSRSPELNIYGLPRMCIWPIHNDTTKRSAYDELIAFCSTVGGENSAAASGQNGTKFYFERKNAWSATEDINIPSNMKLYAYMNALMTKTHPAGGGSFTSKYTAAGMAQIMTTIFDYIRCTNLIDTHGGNQASNTFPMAYTPHYGSYSGEKPNPGAGQVTPMKVGNTKGFGRFVTVSEVALVFYYDDTVTSGAPAGSLLPEDEAWATTDEGKSVPVRCALAIEMFTPSPGYPALSEAYAYSVKEVTPFMMMKSQASGPAVEDPMKIASAIGELNYVEVDAWRGYHGRFFQSTRGFSNQYMWDSGLNLQPKQFRKVGMGTATPDYQAYPLISKRYVLKDQNAERPTNFRIKPGKFEITFYPLDRKNTDAKTVKSKAVTGSPIQTITVDFGTALMTLPVPTKAARTMQARMAANEPRVYTEDVVRSMEANGVTKGDYRIVAALPVVPPPPAAPITYFTRTGKSGDPKYNDPTVTQVHNLRTGWGQVIAGAVYGKIAAGNSPRTDKFSKVPADVNGVLRQGGGQGDFDRGISKQSDGAFINKPDEGNMRFALKDDYAGGGAIPYYRGGNGYEEVGESYFSPNRLIASAVMFGSLPSGVTSRRAWETLLFRPAPSNTQSHKGAQTPLDHYLLDFFHMPVVEPYAISEPLSTAGKININSMLAPFSYYKDPDNTDHGYIERYTGVESLLQGMYQMVVPREAANGAHTERPLTDNAKYRYKIDPSLTIEKSFAPRLKKTGYFHTASEICEVDLLTEPAGGFTDPSQRDSFWENKNTMTGDNQRERPYAHIYPRTTTKSNVFTVHIWSQSLAKSPTSDPGVWDELKDSVTGEYRGSTTIERFIDPNDPAFKKNANYSDPGKAQVSFEPLYRYRIVNNKAFVVRQ